MSEKQRLIAANTRFDQTLLKMIDELEEQQKAEGQYAWMKYDYTPPVTVTNPSFVAQGGSKVLTIKSATFNLNAVQNAGVFFSGFKDSLDASNYFISSTGDVAKLKTYFDTATINATYNPSQSRFDCDKTPGWNEMNFAYNGVKTLIEEIKIPIYLIVDNNPEAYPNGGVHTDGCYYELLASVASANVMNLSDGALEQVETAVINEIVEDVNS